MRGGGSVSELTTKVIETAGRLAPSSIFAPTRKPTSEGASFLRDTGRSGYFSGARITTMPRPGSKTMGLDIAETSQLGSAIMEERDRKRSREQEEKDKRIQRLMEERDARKLKEENRKRKRDEEIAAKKKAYKAEIESKRERKDV